MDEKRELVYEISKWSNGAPEMLQSWSRRDLLQVLCAELGKERKFSNLPKLKLIEHLLKIVSEKKMEQHTDGADSESHPSSSNTQGLSKRQRKSDHPSRLAIVTDHHQCTDDGEGHESVIYCQNSACRATIRPEDAFCKRCSCCICFQYDDNKDPSLWLVCNSEPPNQGASCGLSCHLECALRHEKAGISKGGHCLGLDGGFYCISCGKVNDLLRCWRKQLLIAKDARRVDIFGYRLSLIHKLVHGTQKYQKLYEIVNKAVKSLEAEVGTLDSLPIMMARGIVSRLSSGAEIQKLCAAAVELLDSILSTASQSSLGCNIQEASSVSPSMISIINVSSTSLTVVLCSESALSEELVGYNLWHRKTDTVDYPAEPTCALSWPNRRFFVSNLTPATEYIFKIISVGSTRELGKCEVSFRTSSIGEEIAKSSEAAAGGSKGPPFASPKTNCSGMSNPSSEGDESNSTGNCSSYREKTSMPDLGKVTNHTHKETSYSENAGMDMCCRTTDATEQEEMLGDSVSALDEENVMGEVGSEPNSTIPSESQRDSTNSTNDKQVSNVPKPEKKKQLGAPLLEEISIENESNVPVGNGNKREIVPFGCSESVLPITPSKLENGKDGPGRGGRAELVGGEPPEKWPLKPVEPQAGSSSKKRSAGRCEDASIGDGSLERNYEYCVKVIRWLECEGHIQKSFRVKFLTWFSLRATPQERRVVSVYVDTLIDDPSSLAGQLVDTFSEGICNKRPLPGPSGVCMKLWH
ncbi:VIN3-like protein 2 isoform X1 [Cinnamomum micranthum f. kanehirae]|uniref:VIN3-like protein 2 isoform X1 n=1 Tax=Cinnamomum micranthum f. kanehirae TaxID=337451 RepID=A0A443NVT6_9MAGN|nr:VIN3-like protein 2 isoform X1 [Cinnamomum micranthum f. kanehirae]